MHPVIMDIYVKLNTETKSTALYLIMVFNDRVTSKIKVTELKINLSNVESHLSQGINWNRGMA